MTDTMIFDLDGTLLDTLDDLTDATNYVLKLYGFAPRTKPEVRRFVGNGLFRLMSLAIPVKVPDALLNEAFLALREYYTLHCRNKTKPYEGILPMLKLLKEEGYKTAVVSNKNDAAVKQLTEYYFGEFIETAVGEREGIRRKPCPDGVLETVKILGSEKENTVYVGDSEVDKATADNAGLRCILVSWGFRTPEELAACSPKALISSPEELFKYL